MKHRVLPGILALVFLGTFSPVEASTFPGSNGRILVRDPRYSSDLSTILPDGSGLLRLTYWGAGNDGVGGWSSDGSKIVFSTYGHIWSMNSDGTNRVDLTDAGGGGCGAGLSPEWSPDSMKIVYVCQVSGQVWVMDSDGGNPTQLSATGGVSAGDASWSPNGSKIAYMGYDKVSGWIDVFIMSVADPTAPTRLTNDPEVEREPGWSPDGSKIVYDRETIGSTTNRDIYTMNPDGSGVFRLTTNAGVDARPSWSPDGSQIAFWSDRTGNGDIYLMNPTGSNQHRIAVSLGGTYGWQPCPSTCPSVVETIPPTSTITKPVPGTSYTPAQLSGFTGVASDDTSGVARVEVSLMKKAPDGRCRWWTGKGFAQGGCRKPVWLRAAGRAAWSYSLSAPLRVTASTAAYYRVRSRAKDHAGNVESSFGSGRNSITFEIE